MSQLLIMHMILLVIMCFILSFNFRKLYKQIFIFLPLTLITCVIFNYYLNFNLFFSAILNITIYAVFIKFTFQRDITDALYLSISYWICIELVDLIQQFIGMNFYIESIFVYFSMILAIIVGYIPFLYLDKIEKKLLIFVLPATICLFMIQVLDEEVNDTIVLIVLIGLFISNICYLYFFSFFVRNIELEKEKQHLKKELEFIGNNYNSTFRFLHALIHDNQLISEDFEKCDYPQAKEHFVNMNEKAIKKFNSIYTGNISLSIALSYMGEEKNIQHYVGCDLNDFNEDELTLFFINVLTHLKNQEEIHIVIKSFNGSKVIFFKTNDSICFDKIEEENSNFIKRYKLKVIKEKRCIIFVRLNAK